MLRCTLFFALFLALVVVDSAHGQDYSNAKPNNQANNLTSRLDRLEKQLSTILQEIKSLRKAAAEKNEPAGKPLEVRIFSLRNADANKILPVLQPLLQMAKDSRVRITADPRTNSLIMAAPQETMETFTALISRLDVLSERDRKK